MNCDEIESGVASCDKSRLYYEERCIVRTLITLFRIARVIVGERYVTAS